MWDGGGSTTFVSRPEGEKTYRVVNTPCDGAPRTVSASLFVVSTAPDDKEFNRASIDADTEYITPEGTINLTATGITAAGTPVDIPSSVTWKVDEKFGTIKNETPTSAVFESNGTEGEVKIQMLDAKGEEVGSVTVNVVVPTKFSFKLPAYAAPYGEMFNLTFNVTYETQNDQGEPAEYAVTTHPSDITVTIDNESAQVNDISLTTCAQEDDPKQIANLTAKLECSSLPEAIATFTPGKGSEVIFDFEGKETRNQLANFKTDVDDEKFKMSLEIANSETGKVHSGNQSLKITLDMTPDVSSAVSAGVAQVFVDYVEQQINITGAVGIGYWIWIPDEDDYMSVMVRAIYGNPTPGTKTYKTVHDRTGVNYDEGHWFYAYYDLTEFTAGGQKIVINPMFFSVMQNGQDAFEDPIMSANNKLTYYIDDYTVGDQDVYSKTMLGWLNPTVVNETKTVTLTPSVSAQSAILIPLKFDNSYFGEYLMIDLYSATGLNEMHANVRNSYLYGGEAYGVRIYHISSSINDPFSSQNYPAITDYNNSTTDIALIKLIEADGTKKFSDSDGWAEADDLWKAGQKLSSVFPNYTRNDGKKLNFDIEIVTATADSAQVKITFNS